MKVLILALILAIGLGHPVEWQTGLDYLIKNQPQLSLSSNYPILSSIKIPFSRIFTEVPKVVVMFEHLQFEPFLDVDIALLAEDINKDHFQLTYRLGGPAKVSHLKVRWVAFVDSGVQLIYKEFGFMDLRTTRQGQGVREDSFELKYAQPVESPRVISFLVGFKINPDNGPYSISIYTDSTTKEGCTVNVGTRDQAHIRYAKVAILVVSPQSTTIVKQSGVDSKGFNYFEESSSTGIRRIDYKLQIPDKFFLKPQENIISQGIRGFDANSTTSVAFSLENYQLQDEHYQVNFGPKEQSIVYRIDLSILLHEPALPTELNYDKLLAEQKIAQQKQIEAADSKSESEGDLVQMQHLRKNR